MREISRRQFLSYGSTTVAAGMVTTGATAQERSGESWLGFGHNAGNSGYNPGADVSGYDASQRWTLNAADTVVSGIAVFDRTVFFTDAVGRAYRVTEDGQTDIFEVGTASDGEGDPSTETSTPVLDGDRLYFGGLSEQVIALDQTSGESQWAVDVDGPVRSSPVMDDGSLYVADVGGTVYSLDTANGDVSWTYSTTGTVMSAPALADDSLYVSTQGGSVDRLDLADGDGETVATFDGEITASPVTDETAAYFVTDGGTVAAIEDGVSWETDLGDSVVATPAVADELLYVGSDGGELIAIETAGGDERWRVDLDGGIRRGLAVGNETVVAGTGSGGVYGIEGGEQSWEYDLGTAVTTPVSLADGIIYLGVETGEVFALEPDSGFVGQFINAITAGDIGGAYGAIDDTVPRPFQALGGVGIGGLVAYSVARRYRDTDSQEEAGPAEPTSSGSPPPTQSQQTSLSLPGEANQISDSVPQTDDVDQLVDASYSDFEQLERIGSGGNADVYKVRYSDDGRILALKVPQIADDETVDASAFADFLDEAEIWNGIDDHERIVSVYGWGDQPMPWIAVEYMGAGTLGSQQFGYTEKFAELEGFCEALHHAHRQGVTHTDIKPENILYRDIDGQRVGKLTDWGLATELLDHSMSVAGFTPDYSAPEQLDPEEYGGTDEQTDIYQLGVVAYELFTGELPYGGDTEGASMMAVLNSEPTLPSTINPQLDAQLDDVLSKVLAKRKEHRYETALHFRDDLRRVYNASTRT